MEPATTTNRYLRGGAALALDPLSFSDQFEFDEAELWHHVETINLLPEPKRVGLINPRSVRKPGRRIVNADDRAKSLPVNIPDWSKILRGEYRERAGRDHEDGCGDDGNDVLPPHEYLARTRVASFSVHEGVGRTLKGRDLSRVRNAIWKQTGFED